MKVNIIFVNLLLITLFSLNLQAFYLKGKVVDSDAKAIPFSTVKIQNTNIITSTNRQGYFNLKIDTNVKSKYITASKNGYLIGGDHFIGFDKEYKIILKKLPKKDNKNYKFTPSLLESITSEPKIKKEKVCQECHNSIVKEWTKDKHASSAVNKNFLEIFNKGFKKDFSSSVGNCMKCHMPITALKNKKDINMDDLSAVEKEGISCDFCHKIKDINLKNENLLGIDNMEFLRPNDEVELLFGPMHDVYPRFDAYSSVYEQSKYCASCHSAKFWGVTIYSEYDEWKKSVYPKQNKSCQSCHMTEQKKSGFLADKIKGGYLRDRQEIHSHNMNIDKEFIKNALDIKIEQKIKNNKLYIDVFITNIGAGHDIPTGSPFRHMILKLDVTDENSKNIVQDTKNILPSWSSIKGNGKVFAKIFRPVGGYSANSSRFKHTYPEYFWRPIHLESDTRIPAKTTDKIGFVFSLNSPKIVNLEVTLTYAYFIDNIIRDTNMSISSQNLEIYKKKMLLGVEK